MRWDRAAWPGWRDVWVASRARNRKLRDIPSPPVNEEMRRSFICLSQIFIQQKLK